MTGLPYDILQASGVSRESCSPSHKTDLVSVCPESQEINTQVHTEPLVHLQGTGGKAHHRMTKASSALFVSIYQRKKVGENLSLNTSRHKHIKTDILRKIKPPFQLCTGVHQRAENQYQQKCRTMTHFLQTRQHKCWMTLGFGSLLFVPSAQLLYSF